MYSSWWSTAASPAIGQVSPVTTMSMPMRVPGRRDQATSPAPTNDQLITTCAAATAHDAGVCSRPPHRTAAR